MYIHDFLCNSLLNERMLFLDCLSLIHVFIESLPQTILQVGAIAVKSVLNNDHQCLYRKKNLESFIIKKSFDTGCE